MKKALLKFSTWIKNHLPTQRRLIQLYAALLYNANIKGFITGEIFKGNIKSLCTPGLNCYSCPGAVGACPLGSLQNALASSKTKAPTYIIGIILLYGLILGRTICGFLCPVGLAQELLFKFHTPKIRKSDFTRLLSYLKYVIFFVLVIILPIVYSTQNLPLPAFCKYICPAGIAEGAFGLLSNPVNVEMLSILNIIFSWKFILLICFIILSIFMYRFFCRFICPLGAIYGFFNKFSFLGIQVNQKTCTDCGLCVNVCKMDVKKVGDHECINCGECINVCPTKAISWKGSQILLHPNQIPVSENNKEILVNEEKSQNSSPTLSTEKKKKIFKITSWSIAIALLTGSLVYFNFIYKEKTSGEIGEVVKDFTLNLYNSQNTITSSNLKGKTSLLYFFNQENEDQLELVNTYAEEFKEQLNVLAIHSNENSELFKNYIETHTFNSSIFLAYENENNTVFNSISSLTYPSVIILDKDNIIVHKETNEITNDTLYAVIAPIIAGKAIGNQIGNVCPNYNIPLYIKDGEFSVLNNRGKITLLNFWYTACTPCIAEIPFFEQIANEYSNDVTAIAIAGFILGDEVEAITSRSWDKYTMLFGQDNNKAYYEALGGKDAFPYTIIVDQNGIIQNKFASSVTYEILKTEIEKLL